MSISKVTRKGGVAFQVYGRRAGKTIYLGSFPTRQEAEEAEGEAKYIRAQVRKGNLPADTDPRRTFGEAAEAWKAALKKRRSRSQDQYANRLKLHLLPDLGDTKLVDIAPATVASLRDDLAARYAPATVNATLGCLSSAFSYFKRQGWIGSNPCHGIESIENPNANAYNWIKTREEGSRLLEACKPELAVMVAFALATGLRQEEQLHLRWDDVDLERRLITVHRGRHGTPKSGRVRHVPIVDTLLPLLRRARLGRAGAALVFPGDDGALLPAAALRGRFQRAVKRTGLTLRWHDCRHTFATWYMQDGGDLYRLSKILGHSSIRVTEKYAHHDPAMFALDHGRVRFRVPGEAAAVIQLKAVE